MLLDDVQYPWAARVHGPGRDVGDRQAVVTEQLSAAGPTCRASTSGTRGDRPIRKPLSVMSHSMWSLVAGSVRACTSTHLQPVVAGQQHDGRRGVGEQRVCDDLLQLRVVQPTVRTRLGGGCRCRLVSSQHSSTPGLPLTRT